MGTATKHRFNETEFAPTKFRSAGRHPRLGPHALSATLIVLVCASCLKFSGAIETPSQPASDSLPEASQARADLDKESPKANPSAPKPATVESADDKDRPPLPDNIRGPVKAPEDLSPGLYALIDTNKGLLTAKLFYRRVPLLVANFVGLAEGSLYCNRQGHPFFDGLKFHRVIGNLSAQTGKPQNHDGPGYHIPPEFNPDLSHDAPGVLAMINLGPDEQIGSQFYIAKKPLPWLDSRNPVFGKVVRGLDHLDEIKRGDKIRQVNIHRVGEAAKKFVVDQATFDNYLKIVKEGGDPSKLFREKEKEEEEVPDQRTAKRPDADDSAPEETAQAVEAKSSGETTTPPSESEELPEDARSEANDKPAQNEMPAPKDENDQTVTIPKGRAALLVVNPQNYIFGKDGVARTPYINGLLTNGLLERMKKLVERCRANSVPVVYVKRAGNLAKWPTTPQANVIRAKLEGLDPGERKRQLAIVAALKPKNGEEEVVFEQSANDMFTQQLDGILRRDKAETLIIIGAMADETIKLVTAEAFEQGFSPITLSDCLAAPTSSARIYAIRMVLPVYAIVTDTNNLNIK